MQTSWVSQRAIRAAQSSERGTICADTLATMSRRAHPVAESARQRKKQLRFSFRDVSRLSMTGRVRPGDARDRFGAGQPLSEGEALPPPPQRVPRLTPCRGCGAVDWAGELRMAMVGGAVRRGSSASDAASAALRLTLRRR